MTTTTAKFAAAAALALLAPHALAQLQPQDPVGEPDQQRQGWRFTPTVELRETWTDNIALTRDADKQSELVTEIAPGFLLDFVGPRVNLRARYALHYYAMGERTAVGARRSSKAGNVSLQARVLGDYLFLDAYGNVGQQAISPFGQRIYDNGYASVNHNEVQTWSISPILRQRWGNLAAAELRYTRSGVRSDQETGFGNSDGDTILAVVRSGPQFRTVGGSLTYTRQRLTDSRARSSDIQTLDSRLSWRVSPTLALTGGAGYDKYDYDSLGGETAGRAWSAGFSWTPSRRTSLNAEVGNRFFGPSRSLALLHRSRHTVWNLNYSNLVSNTRNDYLLPATLDTAALLDRLFLPTYSDPAERQRAVEEYMRSTGLPTALANDVSFFGNRYYLQRQLRGGAALRLAKSSAIASVYRVERQALSVRDPDSVLIGTAPAAASDNLTQTGGNMTLSYRLSPRTSVNLTHERNRAESRSTSLDTFTRYTALGARYTGPNKLSVALQLRHVNGTSAFGPSIYAYSENAVSAIVNLKF